MLLYGISQVRRTNLVSKDREITLDFHAHQKTRSSCGARSSCLVSLLCHFCVTFVSLLCHYCVTFVSLLCHFVFNGLWSVSSDYTVVFLGLYYCFRLHTGSNASAVFVGLGVIFVGLYCCFRRTCSTQGGVRTQGGGKYLIHSPLVKVLALQFSVSTLCNRRFKFSLCIPFSEALSRNIKQLRSSLGLYILPSTFSIIW